MLAVRMHQRRAPASRAMDSTDVQMFKCSVAATTTNTTLTRVLLCSSHKYRLSCVYVWRRIAPQYMHWRRGVGGKGEVVDCSARFVHEQATCMETLETEDNMNMVPTVVLVACCQQELFEASRLGLSSAFFRWVLVLQATLR